MKIVLGLALVVLGGAMVIVSAFAGFMAGITIMELGNEKDGETEVDEPVTGSVTYRGMSNSETEER